MLKWYLKKRAVKAMKEPQPLPLGRKEFEQWSTRIIEAAEIPGATHESLRFALAEMILHVKPTESFVCDGYFIHCLRKGAANQVAHSIFTELKLAQQAAAQKKDHEGKIEGAKQIASAKEENLKRLKGDVLK